MKRVSLAGAIVLAVASVGSAQLGTIGSGLMKAKQVADIKISDEEEVEIGKLVSEKIRQRYGVVQDKAVHRYVSLVGFALVTSTARANLPWQFIVLDTDGVNAFAAPGGFVHVTKGAGPRGITPCPSTTLLLTKVPLPPGERGGDEGSLPSGGLEPTRR